MPEPLWLYLMALLYFTNLTTCSAIADVFDSAAHDQVTRLLHGSWSGHTLLHLALRTLFAVARGYLSIDATVVEKPYAQRVGEAAWVWSSKQRKVVCGVSVVLLVWTDGPRRIPVAFRVWHQGGPSKYAWALALLSYARNRLQCKPQFVLFASWDPSKAVLKRLRDYGGYFVCQLKKHRQFAGRPLYGYLQPPSWHAIGPLTGGLKVLGVRHRRKYYATNRLSLTAKEGRAHYQIRHHVEEVIRTAKSPRSLEACQVGYRRPAPPTSHPQPHAQEHHIALCLVAYLMVERERLDHGLSWGKYKQRLIRKGSQVALSALERVREAA